MSTVLRAIDVSSHQPRDLAGLIATHQPLHVIPKLYMPWESISQDHTRAQVQSAWDNGCSAGGYVWCYRSANPEVTIDNVIALCASMGLVLPLLWLDCETYVDRNGNIIDPGPDADWLARAVAQAEGLYGMKVGIYTGLWWVNGHFPGGQAQFSDFSRLPGWFSDYDGNPNIHDTLMPWGWTAAAAKQYTSTPIDLNSIWSDYTVIASAEPPPPPPPDKDEIIEGLRIALDDVGYHRFGEDIRAIKASVASLEATHAEQRRIRVQFLGEQ